MAFVCHFMSVGSTFYVFNVFIEPLCATRGWSRGDLNNVFFVGSVIGFMSRPFFGSLVMRTGPRILLTLGAVVAGVSFILLGQTERIASFSFFYVLLFLGAGAMGMIVANTAVNNWFVRKRGRAMGLATAGISLSGAVLPLVAFFLVERVGLARAFFWIGMIDLVAAPLIWLIVRNRPEDQGLAPDGDDVVAEVSDSGAEVDDGVWPAGALVRTAAFWKMGIAFGLVMVGVVGVMSQLKPRFVDVGFESSTAMYLMCATALVGGLGKYAWGRLCDRFDSRRVAAALMAANAVGLSLALIPGSKVALALFIMVFGFAMGGVLATFFVMVADLYGRAAFASVARFAYMILILQNAGYPIAGKSFDLTGSYNAAYVVFIALDLVAVAIVLSIKRPRPLDAV